MHNLRSIALGTSASMQNPLYVRPNENGFGKDFSRSLKELQGETAKVIADVKRGNIVDAQTNLTRVIKFARSFEPEIIILACSELSAISGDIGDGNDIINPINILADACIEWWLT
ncbi:MAG: hypothetical protein E5V19_00985 [Mesorhizobium sp.]|nr:MAG: hypothetical protein E5V19_00985 [Mesorhizobium sp.]